MSHFLKIIFSLVFISSTSSAFPLMPPGFRLSVELPNSVQTGYDFEGIVSLFNCSGSLIRLENSRDSDPALVLTNGHCLETGFVEPGKVVFKKPSSRKMNLLNSQAQSIGSLQAVEILYATMTKTDMAIYKLKETFGEIQTRMKIRPLILSSQHPTLNSSIEIISGYWKKGYSCAIEAFIPQLKESNWVMQDSIRFSRPGCETVGGTSGSPIILAGTRTVIGVNNTGNENGGSCTMNNPCEIDENGKVEAYPGYSYGQETYWVYSCLNDQYELDLELEGCQLPKNH